MDNYVFNIKGRLVRMKRPWVMGIFNATPDSFYEPARYPDMRTFEGADIIDIGACSTRPGSLPVTADEELSRLEGPVYEIRKAFPDAILSVDTFRAEVAEVCLSRWKVDMVNDISGGNDPDMFSTVARHKALYVLMHMRGVPADMDSRTQYDDVVADVIRELAFRLAEARKAGIMDIFIDPGFGFAKSVSQNFTLLRNLRNFRVLGCPLLVGMSRKRMTRVEGVADPAAASVALDAFALANGADVIRVHDVKAGLSTVNIFANLWNSV